MHRRFWGRLPMPIAWGTECPFSGAERPLRIVMLTPREEVRFRPQGDIRIRFSPSARAA